VRLGHGEYTTDRFEQNDARNLFLIAIQEVAPEVLQWLRDQVLPLYNLKPLDPKLCHVSLEDAKLFLPDELWRELQAWAEKFNLREDWLLEQAIDTLAVWRVCPALTQEPIEWGVYGRGGGYMLPETHEDRRLKFECAGWSPTIERRDKARARIMAEFEAHLGAYLERLGQVAEQARFRQASEKRKRFGDDELTHFKWLVSYQVRGHSHREIAEKYGVDVRAISNGIKSAAALAGIKLRLPSGVGRPRKRPE
jgi:hypothetical protein